MNGVLELKGKLKFQVEIYPESKEFKKALETVRKILTFLDCSDLIQKFLGSQDILERLALGREMDKKAQLILSHTKFVGLSKLSDLPAGELQSLSEIFTTFASLEDPTLVKLN